ncbi:ester cyclase [Pseudorhodoplanes sp.]|uniref:ester cyclase n=1 Tax=Pseudorhodoplanes sp. TaxID=1934341 RepID=UPI002BFA031E|nr:ester cyclase [Pseudorhodoplanes sp.]HWV43620.1 ester cyclase [Pseudorhodoplanes sp.]
MDEATIAVNKRIGRLVLEDMWGKGRLDIADAYYAPDYVDHVGKGPEAGEVRGAAGIKQAVTMFRTAFPDLTYTVEDEIAEGDLVMARFSARGTHLGTFLGVAPTGRSITYTGIDVNRIRDGRIVQSWVQYDALGLLQQLGVVGAIPGM